ncbi:alpha-D-ribose 1-methylphosphonate 5-triphosphate synthase subunit PhnG [Marinobacter sp. MBR-99]|jgi:alpha-D-ribose 1-methylphosphonate 5-triphosphate synthase subunit PhnG|uniref:phosphonate C-P lyase system protein PhnG n=1 Tax=Marinobacter sp. MBR-99 TaxID=3156461 RepID=UPI00339A0CC5
MNEPITQSDWPPPRSQWLRYWSAIPAELTEALAAEISDQSEVRDVTLPQSGLGLLQLPDSALNDLYFLGEVPVSHANVEVVAPDGTRAEGGARLLDDRQSLARALAILDATLAARLPYHEQAMSLLAAGSEAVQQVQAERNAILAATRVDFSLLGDGSEDDDE